MVRQRIFFRNIKGRKHLMLIIINVTNGGGNEKSKIRKRKGKVKVDAVS